MFFFKTKWKPSEPKAAEGVFFIQNMFNPKQEITVFSDLKPKLYTAFTLYQQIYFQIKDKNQRLYLSGPITSGWAINIKNLEMLEVITLNRELAIKLSKFLNQNKEFKNRHITIPHALGSCYKETKNVKVCWGELDYMIFWFMVIMGLSLPVAKRFFNLIQNKIDDQIMNDHSLSKEFRHKEYQKLILIAKNFIKKLEKRQYSPVEAILSFPLAGKSLGSQLEREWGFVFGIFVKQILFNYCHDFFKQSNFLNNDLVFEWLRRNDYFSLNTRFSKNQIFKIINYQKE